MEASVEAMKVALRVLTAISERQPPEVTDIECLKSLVPLFADLPLDELACHVIQDALQRRAAVRARAAKH